MLGAVYGDIIGSYYESHCTKQRDFNLFPAEASFTDDTVLTAAVCSAILYSGRRALGFLDKRLRAKEYAYRYKQYFTRYPYAGFGSMFQKWAVEEPLKKQKSFANGGAMRVIPIAYAYDSFDEVMLQAKLSCVYTHNHREAIAAAQAVAAACYMALHKKTKEQIRTYISSAFHYNLDSRIRDIRPAYVFDSRASYSVPPSILAFLESEDYESAVRNAVSLGGDADTMACIAGGIAEAYYKEIPAYISAKCQRLLESGLRNTFREFSNKFCRELRK